MPDLPYLFAAVGIAAAITWALRGVPFLALAPLRGSALLPYLAERIPIGVMMILAVYTLRHVEPLHWESLAPAAVGVLVTAILHLWKGNMLVSVIAGTASYSSIASAIAA